MQQPKLFDKLTIVLISIIGTPFMGSIIYSQNLRTLDTGDKFMPILFAMVYNVVYRVLSNKFHISELISYLPLNLIGGLILITVFWNKQIGEIEFEPIPRWKPVLIVASIIAIFAIFFIIMDMMFS